ncbi:hypothetical protein HWV62_8489 [Athelia sp. TMB]|nr:hypothetical protein HWV62_8489 [Athelia sp. TMB]
MQDWCPFPTVTGGWYTIAADIDSDELHITISVFDFCNEGNWLGSKHAETMLQRSPIFLPERRNLPVRLPELSSVYSFHKTSAQWLDKLQISVAGVTHGEKDWTVTNIRSHQASSASYLVI